MKKYNFVFSFFRSYRWSNFKYKISCFFKPRNSWVKQSIPRQWIDLDNVYENIVFAGLINFVEKEKCFEVSTWSTIEEKKAKKKIQEIYKWIKSGRFELQKKIDDAYPEVALDKFENGISTKTYRQLYGKVIQLEKLLEDTDTKYMVWLIENRKILWT